MRNTIRLHSLDAVIDRTTWAGKGVVSGDPASFGEVLRKFRTSATFSQEAVGERAGLTLRAISDHYGRAALTR
jgi:hypothetical protein